MRGRVPSCREIAVPPDPEFRLAQAPALGRLLPVGAGTRELGSWLAPLLLIAIAGVGGAILAGGLPAGPAGPVTVGLLAIAAALAAAGLLAQGTAAGEAREQAAALAERSRLARDLHDVLAHSLSVLAVQLEAARLTAITEAAGANLVGQITSAHKQTCVGILNARRALAMLRADEPPGPASLPGLVSETAAALGAPITLEVDGAPCALDPEDRKSTRLNSSHIT